ncbi:ATP-binding protein [Pseudoalteromonas peptidolytica]|uniref:ATP-binding protein n=1 Tax=Pseudoalteromonas peptidolytica TaxID=61150 RepID=UPI00298E615D|nr:ATP-binding protein [Pseudoalteromonas peptidolytica]MDW7551083.1 ATP-binding protein [Pseudoalteromonas peptidolytica]
MTSELSTSPLKFRFIKSSFWLLLVLIIAVAWYVDQVNYRRLVAMEKSRATEEVNVYRTKIEGVLTKNVQLVRGLGIALADQTTLSQLRFEQLARPLFETSQVLRNIGAAPDMRLDYVYPLQGNEKAIGLDYRTHPTQKYGALLAKESREIVMAGPLELLQGGTGLIARIPVFKDKTQFWGLLSVVLDMESLYQQTNLMALESRYLVAIQGVDGKGQEGEYFYGNSNIHSLSPIAFSVNVPSGQWELYAAPRIGWQPEAASIWPFRLAIIALIIIFIAAFVFITRLLTQLQRNSAALTNMGILAEVGAWEINVSTRDIIWSDVTRSIFCVPRHFQPTWMNTTEFFKAGLHRRRLQECIDSIIKTGTEFEGEFIIHTLNADELWVLVKARSVRKGKRTTHIFGSIQNINKRKLMEMEHDKFAKNNELLAYLSSHEALLNNQLNKAFSLCAETCKKGVEANKVSIWQFNDDKTLLIPVCFSNATVDNLVHFPPWRKAIAPAFFNEIETGQLIVAQQAENHPATLALSATYLEPFEIKAMLCCPISHKNNTLGVLCSEYEIDNPAWGQSDIRLTKSIAAMLGSLFINKAHQRARNQAIIDKDLAEQSAKMKAEFLASMSHEIRTPLNGVMGMIELAMHSELTATQHHQLTLAHSSAKSLLTIINDILDFSKIEAGKLTIELVEFDLIEMLSNMLCSFVRTADANNNKLHIDLSGMKVGKAQTDPNRLKQILNNLLSNAIKFTHNGSVTLSCHTEQIGEQTHLWCSVEDTGIGISKEKLNKVFDSFTQADLSTTRQYGGTGLGLTIAKQLSQLLGGDLQAFSKEGIGSTFSCHVLLNQAQPIPVQTHADDATLYVLTQAAEDYNKLLKPWNITCLRVDQIETLLTQLHSPPSHLAVILDAEQLCAAPLSQQQTLKTALLELKVVHAVAVEEQHNLAIDLFSYCERVYYPITPHAALSVFNATFTDPTQSSSNHTSNDEEPLLGRTVLLVEDNKINQTVATTMLERLGITVVCAENGELALTHLQSIKVPYDLIFMDCQMPIMDGYQAAQQIRQGVAGKVHQGCVIVALTANAMQGDREKCLNAGMDDYLSKPINFDDLKAKIWQMLPPEDSRFDSSITQQN